ncbi:hypothetical protein DICPUDRAFT_154235 [Dictyostelium purpureum]|uniref:Uncharacterized protein n=1 Tax=Dictyostelium purpureum TaxID=5786 RepID=F0ZQT6_DICPU|nr:uncharacterized protein DICPUDRAFT_154235 [Dictyostelium purpureum]EGC33698.1 hypothetical protein DICPUDRAFT_154235 [Dictyostelium purpureum]|eukprot:XP_003289775.1 hypothetical protein DICPUDRAFT_154235 [Dictyostelium purpureum]
MIQILKQSNYISTQNLSKTLASVDKLDLDDKQTTINTNKIIIRQSSPSSNNLALPSPFNININIGFSSVKYLLT